MPVVQTRLARKWQLDENRQEWGVRARSDRLAVGQAWAEARKRHLRFSELPVEEMVPAAVHPSHRQVVLCGGHVGCLLCGTVAGWRAHGAIDQPCRMWCPEGSRGPVRKVLAGQLPHVQRGHQGKVWPSGQRAPSPRRLAR